MQPAAGRLHVSGGDGRQLSSVPLDSWDATYMNRWIAMEPATSQTYATWAVTRDFVDLDGDGRSDYVFFDPVTAAHYYTDPPDDLSVRLMHSVDNGVGKTTHIRYAANTDPAAVIEDLDAPVGMPNHTWVVTSMERVDIHSPTATPSITTYRYFDPVWNQDEDGKWGFRGFERTESTSPTGMLNANLFDYGVDWTGRMSESLAYAYADAADLNHPHLITAATWAPYTLFSGAISTFHKTNDRTWRCSNGQTYSQCKQTGAFSREYHNWVAQKSYYAPAGEALAYVPFMKGLLAGQAGYQNGDRQYYTARRFYANDDRYRLREYSASTKERELGVWVVKAKAAKDYDIGGLVVISEREWIDTVGFVRTVRTYDLDTGNVATVKKPQQHIGSGAVTSFAYDDHELFVTSTLNELNQLVETETDWATGVVTSTIGPNTASCGWNCTALERTDIVIDGFGRALETWVSVDDPVLGYRQELVAKATYCDNESPQRVRAEALLDYGGTDWVTTDTIYDGHGRVLSATTLLFDPLLPDAVTTYTYDEAGRLVVVEVPSQQNDTSTVTYTYAYDALGRPTEIREPGLLGVHNVGIDMTYNGQVRTRTEVVEDGTSAETELIYDVYERLIEVRERLDSGGFAVTAYEFDANNNLNRITDAEGNVTELDHDWLSRRIAVTRAGQTWSYGYDHNGNRTSVVSPYAVGEQVSLYTTSLLYDDLDRVESVIPAVRDLSPGELTDFMIGPTDYAYDTGKNGTGRLASVTVPHGTSTYEYSARGEVINEEQSFDLQSLGLPYADTRDVTIAYGAAGQVTDVWHADGTSPWDASWTTHAYDGRGLPASVTWHKPGVGDLELASNIRGVAGNVRTRKSGTQTRTWTFDTVGRVRTDTVALGAYKKIYQQLAYYSAGDVKSAMVATEGLSPRTLSYDYDRRHQLVAASDTTDYDALFTYTDAGRLDTAYVDVAPTAPGATSRNVRYDYDGSADPEAVDSLYDDLAGVSVADYVYDGAWSWSQRTWLASVGPGAQVTLAELAGQEHHDVDGASRSTVAIPRWRPRWNRCRETSAGARREGGPVAHLRPSRSRGIRRSSPLPAWRR